MEKTETAKVLATLKIAYPRYYSDKSPKEIEQAVSLWQTMLEEYPAGMVNVAIKALIATNKFPPTIAEVIERINFLTKPKGLTDMEAWGLVKTALRDSGYNCVKAFEKLPEEVREAVGSPSTLHEWSMMESSRVDTVIASNFMRSFRAKEETRKQYGAIPAGVKALIASSGLAMIEKK